MGPTILVTALTTVLFAAMLLLLAIKSKVVGKITGVTSIIVAVGALLIYSYGYSYTLDSIPLAVIRGMLSVCGMFLGSNELSAISAAPLMQQEWMILIFWLLHMIAFYMTAGAAIVAVGSEALKKLRLWLARRGKMNLIFGIHPDSLELGRKLSARKGNVVVYLDGSPDAGLSNAASAMGCVVRSDGPALGADPKFLRSVGIGRHRQVALYAVSKDPAANLRVAGSYLRALETAGLPASQIRLAILGQEEAPISRLQVTADRYGYGFVSAIREEELAARLLTREYPPCDCVRFDGNGAATEDFEALIVGFGRMGQAVLRQLVMNAQFQGSHFRAAVFAPDCQSASGYFSCRYASLLEKYDISLHPHDARSRQLFDYLRDRGEGLKYAVICTGNDRLNREIAEELTACFRMLELRVPVFACAHSGVKRYNADGVADQTHSLYDPELLSMDTLDRMAMVINQGYHTGTEKTPLENWMDCDYFSRQSCRASADFVGAFLRAAGMTGEQAAEHWQLSGPQLENLSRTEHLRWCAFHYAMGFFPMTREEFDARAAQYRAQLARDGKASIRLSKNMVQRTHACLTDWEELEELGRREAAVTGKYVDYQQMDTQNVLAVPELLRSCQ